MTEYDWIWLWLNMTDYDWIGLNRTQYDWIWSNMTKYNWLWLNMTEYDWIWLKMTHCTPAHFYFNITEWININKYKMQIQASSWSRSISPIYTAAHGVQILYTLLQVGSLCDIHHIVPLGEHLVFHSWLSQRNNKVNVTLRSFL